MLKNIRAAVNGHVASLEEIVGANIVEPGSMVFMSVGENHCIEAFDVFTKHLLPEIRTGIDHYAAFANSEMNRSAQPFVAKVHGGAHLAPASDDRDALRSSGAKKGDLHAKGLEV